MRFTSGYKDVFDAILRGDVDVGDEGRSTPEVVNFIHYFPTEFHDLVVRWHGRRMVRRSVRSVEVHFAQKPRQIFSEKSFYPLPPGDDISPPVAAATP